VCVCLRERDRKRNIEGGREGKREKGRDRKRVSMSVCELAREGKIEEGREGGIGGGGRYVCVFVCMSEYEVEREEGLV